MPCEVGVVLALQVPSRPQLHPVLHSFHLCHQAPQNLSKAPPLAFLYLFFYLRTVDLEWHIWAPDA